MKKIKIQIFILVALFAINGCDVLDQEPESLIATTNAIQDARSAESALNGVYHLVQNGDLYGARFILANEMLAENARATAFQAFWQELDNGNVPASNFHLEDMWISAYAVINASNAIIASVPEIADISEGDADRIMGTAHFFRALMHFDLLRQFGEFFDQSSIYGVPLILTPSLQVAETSRSSVVDTYQQINDDLAEAMDRLPDSGDRFYVSVAVAQALQARVALYQEDFATAETMAGNVISNGTYNLSDDYNEVYDMEGADESIFELNFIQLNDPNAWALEMYGAPPEVSVTNDLLDFFNETGETDRALLFDGSTCIKYGSGTNEDGGNTILFRLSEMYLIRAEAQARKAGGSFSDALADLNVVRDRANQPDISGIATEDQLFTFLLNERRAEFAFEGHYWFDLVRLGRMEEVTGRAGFRSVMPIPFREINISDGTLEQNPGYSN